MAEDRTRRARPNAPQRPAPGQPRSGPKPPTKKQAAGGAAPKTAAKRLANPGAVKTWVRRGSYGVILAMIAAIGGGFMALNAVEVPEIDREVKNTSFVCLADVPDGECTAATAKAQFSAGGSHRIYVPLDDISPNLINAVIAAEDRSFFKHNGVDAWGIIRAAYRQVAGSASRQGGSTITQQYVKMVYLTNEGTFERKFNEAAIALKIEREMTKAEILEAYLNEAPFGRGAIGIEAAARSYFAKDAASLTVTESAYLAGLLRAPSYADEPTNPDKPKENKEATRRRHTVLVAMHEMGYITGEQLAEGDAQPFEDHVTASAPSQTGKTIASDFRDMGGEYILEWVRQLLVEKEGPTNVGQSALFGGGLKVYLEIDPTLQFAAFLSTQAGLNEYPGPAAAMMSVDDEGRIKAMIGGQNFATSEVNLALGQAGGGSGRQPGSTMKPVALAAYVAAGNSIKSEFWAPPTIEYLKANGELEWKVSNYEGKDLGKLTVEAATWYSSNTVYAQMMKKIGIESFSNMAKSLGIMAEQKRELGAVLGTTDTSVLEMTVAFATLGNHGERRQPHIIRRIESASGEVLYDAANDGTLAPVQAIDAAVADTVAGVLTGSVHSGTGANAKLSKPAAGKTGTTDDNKDAWFAGFSCGITAVVWMGFADVDENAGAIPAMVDTNGKPVTGGGYPARMWQKYMENAIKGRDDCAINKVDVGTIIDPIDEQYGPTTTTTIPPAPLAEGSTTAPTTAAAPGQPSQPGPQTSADPDGQPGDAARPGA